MSTKEPRKSKFKFKVAMDAVIGKQTLSDMCIKHKVTAGQIYKWKKQLLDNGDSIFDDVKKSYPSREQMQFGINFQKY